MVDDQMRLRFLEKAKREIGYWRSYANFLDEYSYQLQNRTNTSHTLVKLYVEREPTPPPGSRIEDIFQNLEASTVCLSLSFSCKISGQDQ